MSLAARAKAAQLRAQFEAEGADPVECAVLQSADTLLDLYGEDIRARAFVTQDPARGEMMLRPDYTVPVVEMHMQSGATPACYTYAGEVFRRQETDPDRPSEYIQVGFELFDDDNPAAADARVFALFAEILTPAGLRPVTGDIGILTAALTGLNMSKRRRMALMRHLWRPRRFRSLMEQFAGKAPIPASRAALLSQPDPVLTDAPLVGLRDHAEIMDRIVALRADAAEGPLSPDQLGLIDQVLAVRQTCPFALRQLRDIALDLPALTPALDLFESRMNALQARGVEVENLAFEASYGRTSMEYYDGFVFGFVSDTRPDLPPVATGGRYDALTQRLGQGRKIAAVGGVIRPDLLLAMEAVA